MQCSAPGPSESRSMNSRFRSSWVQVRRFPRQNQIHLPWSPRCPRSAVALEHLGRMRRMLMEFSEPGQMRPHLRYQRSRVPVRASDWRLTGQAAVRSEGSRRLEACSRRR